MNPATGNKDKVKTQLKACTGFFLSMKTDVTINRILIIIIVIEIIVYKFKFILTPLKNITQHVNVGKTKDWTYMRKDTKLQLNIEVYL